MKKCALRQSKDGIIVSFVLHQHEVPKQLQTADIGSRWMVALVELNDDETPVHRPVEEHPEVAARPKGSWRDLEPCAQSILRCKDPVFLAFLRGNKDLAVNPDTVPNLVRHLCGVKSRSELNTNHKARVIWHQLDSEFQAWKLAI
jgi:hypothetical protein